MKLTDYIPVGKENAISAKDLASLAGFKDVRKLQAHIHNCRVQGEIICSVSGQDGGYYIPNPERISEVQEFVNTLDRRALHTIEAVRSAKEYLNSASSGGGNL